MSENINTYTFLPWLRTGLANSITSADKDEGVKLRTEITVNVKVEGASVTGGAALTGTLPLKVQLYGPGDIVGIDSKAIIKTEPHNLITNFEPNYLAYIDFYDEDFAWRYTPAKPDLNHDRLRPWIMLVVLEETEFGEGKNIKDKPLPYIQLKSESATLFPPPDDLWAWAHIHVNSELINSIVATESDKDSVISKFKAVLKNNPDEAYCRILSPRKLLPNKSYHAFLLPVFETGRLAGLGLPTEEVPYATLAGWEPHDSWTRTTPEDYPYYTRWYFRTGEVGDFEYLVRLLEPRPMDKRVGTRDMDVQTPGYNIDGINDPELHGILKLGGALKIPETNFSEDELEVIDSYNNWDEEYPHPFQQDLSRFLNLAEEYTKKTAENANTGSGLEKISGDPDPLITPPIYGQWHALTRRLLIKDDGTPAPNNTNWLHNLNLDPRHRVAAGFGTKVVQENQENYMHAAWKQIGDVLEANRQMRQSQLAMETSGIWHARHLAPLVSFKPEKLFILTAPLHTRVVTRELTVKGHIRQSIVPESVFSSTLRRILRPRGRLARLLPFTDRITPANLADRINKKEVVTVPPKLLPSTLPTHDQVAQDTIPANFNPKLAEWLLKHLWIQWLLIALAVIIILLVLILKPGVPLAGIGGGWVLLTLVALWYFINQIRKLKASAAVKESSLTPGAVGKMPKSPDFKVTKVGETFRPGHGFRDSNEAKDFKSGLKNAFSLVQASKQASAVTPKQPLDIAGMVNVTFTAINPNLTIPRLFRSRVFIPGFISKNLFEQFTEAMAYPEFDIPMYEHLVNISSELFLPNISFVPANSISLLETNQQFIESYMVGLNHEFARELLWREYPTDQRGSYFRQFWDVSGFYNDDESLSEEALKEKMRDIPPIHLWSKFSELGDHDNREEGGSKEEEVVLVIRGELLKKYPTAVIYAHKAEWQMKDGKIDNKVERKLADLTEAEKNNPPRTKVKTPLYEAKVQPDIYFFGFDLTAPEAKGGSGNPGDEKPGWFFVIKERPGEPRFGLDVAGGTTENPDVWNDLSWDRISHPEIPNVRIADLPAGVTLSTPDPDDEGEKTEQHNDDVHVSLSAAVTSAELAYILYQSPVMVAVHGSEMLHGLSK